MTTESNSVPSASGHEITAAMCAQIKTIVGEMSPASVVQRLALHASTDAEFLRLLLDVWVQQLDHAPDVSFETEISGFIYELLTLPANFAVMTMRSTGGGGGGSGAAATANSTGDWYLFGLEHARFKVPFELMRSNYVILASLFRLMYQGQPLPGRPLFAKVTTSADRSEVAHNEFTYPDLFSAHFDRVALVAYFLLVLCSKTVAAAAAAAASGAAAGENDTDYVLVVRQLLLGAMQRVETRLAAPTAAVKRPEWLVGNDALARLHEITVLCQSRESFDPGRFMTLFNSFIHRRLLVVSCASAGAAARNTKA
jgi:hypothetical protein